MWHTPGFPDAVVQTATHTGRGRIASVGGIGANFGATADWGAQGPRYDWGQLR